MIFFFFFWKYTNKSEEPRNSNVSSSYSDLDFRALGHAGNSRGSSVVSFVVYLYVNGSESITSVGEERANLSAVVYL